MQTAFSYEVTAVSGEERLLEICVGDATDASPADRVDLLALSCFRDDYVPTPRTIVRALRDKGINVRSAARSPARDYRDKWHTWISKPLGPEASFGRLVCFEHERRPPAFSSGWIWSLSSRELVPIFVAPITRVRVLPGRFYDL